MSSLTLLPYCMLRGWRDLTILDPECFDGFGRPPAASQAHEHERRLDLVGVREIVEPVEQPIALRADQDVGTIEHEQFQA
ncbi:hypothetical protein [Burkholderia thailandensis]|uniref:hypothetical protein n=1 Tax=Burkholderia thailandensis TaxID=57975 RepID=UPI0021B2DEEF|nr:hypothetical protein [Burkholderia thailandensis]